MSPFLKDYAVDPLERASWTFLQTLVVIALPFVATATAAGLVGVPWLSLLDQAGAAGVLSLATSILTFAVPDLGAGWDFVLRIVKTFGQAFFGIIVAAHITSVVHAPWQNALLTAIPVTFLAILKGLAALSLPWSKGASIVPAADFEADLEAALAKLPAPAPVEAYEGTDAHTADVPPAPEVDAET